MIDDKANALIDKILADYEKNGATADVTVPMIKDLRQIAKDSQDPLVIRVLRHTSDFITDNEGFDLDYFAETYDEEEDGEYIEEDQDSFVYLMELVKQSDNKFNREEIRKYVDLLK